jgi:hypothetical protein
MSASSVLCALSGVVLSCVWRFGGGAVGVEGRSGAGFAGGVARNGEVVVVVAGGLVSRAREAL